MEPLVYIVLVNYNGYKDTLICIDSIDKINYKNYKVIIIDNASTDESLEKIKKICSEKVKLISLDENLGFSGGNNVGINFANNDNADFIVLLNNDTIVTPNFLTPLIYAAAKENSITSSKIMYAKEKQKIWYDGGRTSKKLGRSWHNNINKLDKNTNNDTMSVSFISGCCMCIPKDIIKRLGNLSEEYFLYYEDTDYCCRAINEGVKLLYIPHSLIYHNVSSSTGHNSPIMTYYKVRNRLYFIKKYSFSNYKFFATGLFIIEVFIGVLIKKYDLKSVKLGIRDYKNNITGKLNN